MPVLPVSVVEPIWDQFVVLMPPRPAVAPSHPLGCHRPRVPDRMVFDHVLAALVHGSGYERIATPGCSDRTIRRRLHEWAEAGLVPALHALVLTQYDRMIGLELDDVAVDGCITKAPGGGEVAGRSPVDRGKQGLKRSVLTDATGVPLGMVATGANRHDSPLLAAYLSGAGGLGHRPRRNDGASGPGRRQRRDARAVGRSGVHRGDRAQRPAGTGASRHAVGD